MPGEWDETEYLQMLPWCFALWGACAGSFLNAVIYRIPRGMKVTEPRRSFCPHCKAPIPWYFNIPIISWLLLRGKAACCGKRISPRYILVEVACAALFWQIAQSCSCEPVWVQALKCVWAAGMLCMLVIDWEVMSVYRGIALITFLAGAGASCGSGVRCADLWGGEEVPCYAGVAEGVAAALTAFLLFFAIMRLGTLFLGGVKRRQEKPVPWKLVQDGADIRLDYAEEHFYWSQLAWSANRPTLTLEDALITAPEEQRTATACTLRFRLDTLVLPDNREVPLADLDELNGTCCALSSRRTAMGLGDAWVAACIGVTCGVGGVLFSLIGGSILSLITAVVLRKRKGEPVPFAPALIIAAWGWLFWEDEISAVLLHLA